MVAGGAIDKYALVYGAADGKVSATPNANFIGTALDSASGDGSYISVARGVVVASPGDLTGQVVFDDDLLTTFPAAGAAITLPSPWAKRETEGLGVTSEAAAGGIVTLEFDAVAEVAAAALFHGTAHFDLDKAPIFEALVNLVDEGDAAAVTFRFGLVSGDNATFASIAQYALFEIAGDTRDIKFTSKDGTTTVAAVDTTVDFATGFQNFKIDATDKEDVKVYINGARVLPATTFKLDATARVMPWFAVVKTSNDTTAEMQVDRVRLTASR